MKNKKAFIKKYFCPGIFFLLFFAYILFFSCSSVLKKEQYYLYERTFKAENGKLSFDFFNNADSPVLKAEFELGLLISGDDSSFDYETFCFTKDFFVLQNEYCTIELLPEDFLLEDCFENAELNYCFASKIFYEDGTVFEDSFGRFGIK